MNSRSSIVDFRFKNPIPVPPICEGAKSSNSAHSTVMTTRDCALSEGGTSAARYERNWRGWQVGPSRLATRQISSILKSAVESRFEHSLCSLFLSRKGAKPAKYKKGCSRPFRVAETCEKPPATNCSKNPLRPLRLCVTSPTAHSKNTQDTKHLPIPKAQGLRPNAVP
jgi:hypothetical protein